MKGVPTRLSSFRNTTQLSKALINHLQVVQARKKNKWPKITRVSPPEESFVLGDYPLDLKENKK